VLFLLSWQCVKRIRQMAARYTLVGCRRLNAVITQKMTMILYHIIAAGANIP